MTRRPVDDRLYLTIVTWPEGAGTEEVIRLLGGATGVDAVTARARLGRPPPMIFGLLDPAATAAAVDAIRGRGGDAFGCTLGDIEALGPTHTIRDLRLVSGHLALDLWRRPPRQLDPAEIEVVVRARLSERERAPGPALTSRFVDGTRPLAAGWAFGGAYGLAAAVHVTRDWGVEAWADKKLVVSHKLDLHARDGTVYQIDGDKFGFQILGELRGHSDNVNIDRMCELITHLVPEVVVDPYFALWVPPPAHDRLRLPMMKINEEDPAFAFYSRWTTLMYRHVLGRHPT